MRRRSNDSTIWRLLAAVILIVVFVFGFISCNQFLGIGVWGPTRTWEVTVISKHVDVSSIGDSNETNYMVTTDKGTFEVQNGLWLGVWNADELYGRLREGKRFSITTEGNQVVGMFFQEYPYVTQVTPLE